LDGFGLSVGEGLVSGSSRLLQTQAAQDAAFSVNGLSVTRGTNLVAGVVSGTTLNLKAVTSGPVTLTVERDPGSLVEDIQGFVDAYNELKVLADNLTFFDATAGENGAGAVLLGDSTLRTVTSSVQSLLRSSVEGLTGSVRSLAEIGISTDQNSGFQLRFDTARFQQRYEEDPEVIKALFANAGTTTDDQIEFVASGDNSVPGNYDIVVETLATVGSYSAAPTPGLAAGNIVIDSDNDSFSVLLNGVAADISLTQGTYATAADLAQQIQQQINSDNTLNNGNHAVSVVYDSEAQRFELSSNIYGSNSSIRFT
jgi:flagellar hook-associated protein 2